MMKSYVLNVVVLGTNAYHRKMDRNPEADLELQAMKAEAAIYDPSLDIDLEWCAAYDLAETLEAKRLQNEKEKAELMALQSEVLELRNEVLELRANYAIVIEQNQRLQADLVAAETLFDQLQKVKA